MLISNVFAIRLYSARNAGSKSILITILSPLSLSSMNISAPIVAVSEYAAAFCLAIWVLSFETLILHSMSFSVVVS